MPSADDSLEAVDLYKIYRSQGGEVVALKGLSARFEPRTMTVVMGPSGSGKSTLLNLLGGLDVPSAGQIKVRGQDIVGLDDRSLAQFRLKTVGYVFQSFNLLPNLNALENVLFPMALRNEKPNKARERAEGLLELIGLQARATHRPAELSGGEQQRVAIATALANDPPFLLADEPTGELDSTNRDRILEIFSNLRDGLGKTVIVATHDPRIKGVANQVLILEDGKIVGREIH